MTDERRFSIETTVEDGAHIIAISGEIDITETERVDEAIAASDGGLVVDLRGCTFMGSEGLHALFSGRRLAIERERRLVVVVARGGRVERLIHLVGGEGIFNLCHDLTTAVAMATRLERRQGGDRRSNPAAA